ncbi:M56 family metallopeptidase [Gimesia panareensis]|uniref:M56 family metallopeptidase n=1 Tax=Gimesia panareensis TaxID=2527978 RepID=UPI00118A014C|nr:M56 family metallopeptidase [Gimesia panareensis]QDU47748.1 Regulatory protein BlaR1 [Gimesia panareensis]
MSWHHLIDPTWNSQLCLTLLHSFWQIILLTLLVWSIDRLWKSMRVEQRYTLYVSALILACLTLPANFQWLRLSTSSQAGISQTAALTTTALTQSVSPAAQPEVGTPTLPLPVPAESTPPQTAEPLEHQARSPQLTARLSAASAPFDWRLLTPWIVGLYLAGVVLMLLRLLASHLRIARVRKAATLISEGPCAEILTRLSAQWNLKVRPALACVEQIVVPQVTGLLRPTILLPASVLSSLSVGELELILAHELAHIRRHDLWVNLLQRLAEVVLFFNPALWYLSHRISLLREYCCDEMTCQNNANEHRPLAEARVAYSTALLRVAELAHRSRLSNQQLTSLSAAGRSPSEIRRRVARLFGEPLNEPLPVSRGGICTLLILTTALPVILFLTSATAQTAEQKPPADKADVKTADSNTETDSERLFQLKVVDPAGKPVPHVTVEIRSDPAPTAKQIIRGKYLRKATYGPFAQTNDQGELFIQIPHQMQRFNLSIKKRGFGPYWAGWNVSEYPQAVPDEFTAILDQGWSVGGIVVDEAGKPIKGAKVSPSVKFKKRPGDTSTLGVGTKITTDAEGRWRYDYVPGSKPDLHIDVNHPEFRSWRGRLSREKYGLKPDQSPTQQIALKRGLSFTGTVTDENGKPIAGALIRTKFLNDKRKATTDEHGVYVLSGCEPNLVRVVASAKGRALEMQEVRVSPDMDPVDFVLKPGGHIRIRVVDEQGKGIPKARIFFQRWRGRIDYFEFDHIGQYADKNGVWEWNEAPLDEFRADICRPGGMQLSEEPLVAREKEYVFTPPRALVVSGRVVDAKTKQPIKKFLVTPGLRNSNPRIGMNWIPRDSFEATDGTYRVRLHHDYPAHLVRIEAPGYQMAISRDIQTDEGEVNIDFALKPAGDIAATILTPDKKPASNAKVALGVKGSQISVQNGEIDDSSTNATQVRANEKGRFHFSARQEPWQLVITHPAGFAHYKSDSGPLPDPLPLTPWARVEGVFKIGEKPGANLPLTIMTQVTLSYGKDEPNIFTHHDVTSDQLGRYVFQRVWPGKGRINRRPMLHGTNGAMEVTSAIRIPLQLVPGKTITQDIGGTGRVVTGKLAPPEKFKGKPLWQFAMIDGRRFLNPPPGIMSAEDLQKDPLKFREWFKKWKESDNFEAEKVIYQNYKDAREKLLAESPSFFATVARDGTFRIDDVPPGNYALSVDFYQNRVGRLKNYIFTVPPADQSEPAEPVDLGTLNLE